MTNQEKELIELIEQMDCKYGDYGEAIYDSKSLYQAIIAKYPQILSEFVAKEKVIHATETKLLDILYEKYKGKAINIYCSEVVE